MGAPLAVAYHRDALAGLRTVEPKKVREQIIKRIAALVSDPTPPGCKKIIGGRGGVDDVYRVRQGVYRILYSVSETEVLVLDIGHRKEIYR